MPRSQNRTARGQNPAAREQILTAAREEFAEAGYNGGRIDSIARRSGLNKQLVYYYFGSKDDLYRAALEAIYSEIRLKERELDLRTLPPEEAITRLIDFSLNYLAQHNEFIRMLADENAMGAPHMQNAETMLATNSPLISMIGATLRDGEAQGIFRKGVDPLELYISIAGMTFFYFANGKTMSAIFGRNLADPAVIESYRSHIVTMVLKGLRA
ncbi:TetR/AcrR family transcriptional regulator [Falsigemmobacter intermedius]|uniref:TetR family transcriptional regulator n=1 Tax=Falsigemmobacter intermedius TaxID=1553448 RepID=A0A444MBR0_9RHOB|nr:TetR/AcrR family transcriptional regulator [Falsigemmobacter intermedius]RWY41427.1 TetR family transcriptional regulator [Falsigemmobacter intermedius]